LNLRLIELAVKVLLLIIEGCSRSAAVRSVASDAGVAEKVLDLVVTRYGKN